MTAALTVAEVLERAADLLTPEGAWIKGRFATDADGHTLDGYAKDAICWCAVGAIENAAGTDFFLGAANDATNLLRKSLRGISISDWNDDPSRTQAEVVAALRAAAVIAKGGA